MTYLLKSQFTHLDKREIETMFPQVTVQASSEDSLEVQVPNSLPTFYSRNFKTYVQNKMGLALSVIV
jgi:hypothetical protein